ncbi:MAG: glycoside hydrolase family 3 protein [Proteobacteria bacterium]|nr:glycoside hydrolase family 3 protein [Pseudomonadota bacterium]
MKNLLPICLIILSSCSQSVAWERENSCTYQSNNTVQELLIKMTIEEKVGQVLQPDLDFVTFEDIQQYQLGSVLNGGNTAPYRNNDATPEDWKRYAEELFNHSPVIDGVRVPVLWGTDAVHGHSNIKGATLFPHNIGLGATHNPELLKKIGEAVALEVLSTGVVWTFAPTIAVPQNDSWGRAYEGFSEDPELVSKLGKAMIEGLQGSGPTFLDSKHILATAKHFLGDGGTTDGIDRGNTELSEQQLREIHGLPYLDALDGCVQSVMASFNSWNGVKMHSSRYMLTDVLKGRMQFDGFIVGDWNGHGEIPGCTNDNCPEAFNAGVDMYMVPENWKELRTNLLQQISDGIISIERLDDAVTRILNAKARIGLLNGRKPHEYKENHLKSSEHMNLARQAVRESLVLLKNNNQTLPLQSSKVIGVIGKAANLIRYQTGGWTITWQGSENKNTDFINEISILEALEDGATKDGHTIIYSETGLFDETVDLIIAVFGEEPYAEMLGDIENMKFNGSDLAVLPSLQKYQKLNIPTLSIFLSGRPMEVNEYLNASDAFIAAWLPGSGVKGISDLLFDSADYDFTGKLSFSWPRNPSQTSLNYNDVNYDPLFPLGYGLSLQDQVTVPNLEVFNNEGSQDINIFLGVGRNGFEEYYLKDTVLEKLESDDYYSSDSNFSIERFQYIYQDDSKRIKFTDTNDKYGLISLNPIELNGSKDGSVKVLARAFSQSNQPVQVVIGSDVDKSQANITLNSEWTEQLIPLSCFGEDSRLKRLFFSSKDLITLEINSISISQEQSKKSCF